LTEVHTYKKRAYLMLEVQPGKEPEIIRALMKIKNIVTVDSVHGEYDLVAVIEGDHRAIDETIIKARAIPHVRKTVTLTVFDVPQVPEDLSVRDFSGDS